MRLRLCSEPRWEISAYRAPNKWIPNRRAQKKRIEVFPHVKVYRPIATGLHEYRITNSITFSSGKIFVQNTKYLSDVEIKCRPFDVQ